MDISSWKYLAATALALAVVGCTGGGPRLYKAGGTVTHKSAPLEGAHVTFLYADGNFANGYTDAAGKFQLSYSGRIGAVPGKCKVTVSKKAGAAGVATTTNFKASPKSVEEQKAMMAEQQRMMEGTAKKQEQEAAGGASGDLTRSGLEYEITTDESKNDFVIDIKD